MRRFIIFFAVALTGILVSAGCGEDIIESDGMEPGIALTVRTSAPELAVKGTSADGVDTYNENKLTSFYYFFFPKDVSDQPAVVSGFASGFSTTGTYTENIPVSSGDLNSVLFSGDRQCSLFIIANPTESMKTVLGNSSVTLAQLRAATVLSSMDGVQDSFVMVYDDHVTIDSRVESKAIEVSVALKRLACKFTFNADVKSQIKIIDGVNTLTWTAVTDSKALYVTFGNAINKTTPAGFDEDAVEDADYFDSTPVEMTYNGVSNDKIIDDVVYKTYSATLPVYSYPMDWVFTDEHEPYMMFDFVWDYDDGTTQRFEHRYYKLMLGQQSITANDWYVITAKLTGIGSLLPRDPVTDYDNLNYSVHNWNDAFDLTDGGNPNTPAQIKSARFLMSPKAEFEIQNETTCVIPFSSSHMCEVKNITVTKSKFFENGGAIPGTWPQTVNVLTNANVSQAQAAGFNFTVESDKVTFEHALHNDIDSNLDHSPYYITFTLSQTGTTGSEMSQIVTLTQYPAIWIEYEKNSATGKTNGTLGYAYFNNNNTNTHELFTNNTDRRPYWNKISGREPSGSTSASPYMIKIHVSQFSEGNYIIGDPRVKTAVTMSEFWSTTTATGIACESAPAKYGTSPRTLQNYYPAEDGLEYKDYIAPVLRVTSAVGRQSFAFKYEQSKVACASYQEDGYPAGRWRLPSAAEALFINKMANDLHMICPLYSSSQYYWCAGGYLYGGNVYYNTTTATVSGITPANNSGSGQSNYGRGTANIRCVYDEWYWSRIDKDFGWTNSWPGTDYSRIDPANDGKGFVWGDMPRNYTLPSK